MLYNSVDSRILIAVFEKMLITIFNYAVPL